MSAQGRSLLGDVTVADDLAFRDIGAALAAGWRDFRACPVFGLFFASVYVVAGLGLSWVALSGGQAQWLMTAVAGFPLLAPFIAVGLYEVSRRREAGLEVSWRAVLGALRGHDDDQILMMGGILFVGFTFWVILAHGIFAIFMAESGVGSESLALFGTPAGLMMLLVGGVAGALMALAFYAVTIVSLPLLVDREIDFITAMIASLAALRANPLVLVAWGVLISVSLFVAMLPFFSGLLLALPILGHATWHLHRRIVGVRTGGR